MVFFKLRNFDEFFICFSFQRYSIKKTYLTVGRRPEGDFYYCLLEFIQFCKIYFNAGLVCYLLNPLG